MAKDIEQWATRITLLTALALGGGSLAVGGADAESIKAAENRLTKMEEKLDRALESMEVHSKQWQLLSWLERNQTRLSLKTQTDLEVRPRLGND